MAKPETLEAKMTNRIFKDRKRQGVFMREDFADLGWSYSQVGRVLSKLVKDKRLLNIGYGLYARTEISSIDGETVIDTPIQWLTREFLARRGINVLPTKAGRAQKAGTSTQVPTGNVIGVDKRVTRKITYKGTEMSYELVP